MSAMVMCGRCRLWKANGDGITGQCLYRHPAKYVQGLSSEDVISTLPAFQCPYGKPLPALGALCTVANGK
jgi:hypothetical protein